MTVTETMKCAAHPEVETTLRCGKCGKPICPRCMIQTPVGARCRDCARLNKLPTYRVSTVYYLRATGTALGMALAVGIVWGLIANSVPFIVLNLILAGGAGYAIGEVTGLAINRKRGKWLAVIGGIAVVLSYAISVLTFGKIPSGILAILLDFAGVAIGIYMAVSRLR
jgi:hypothetical protein